VQEGIERTKADPFGGMAQSGAAGAAVSSGLSGDDFLKTLAPNIATEVKAYAEGRRPFPSGMAMKTPYFQKMIELVGQYDPTFDAANFNARSKARQDFTSGASAKNINALNTVVGHLSDLSQKASALGNSNSQYYNELKNWVKTKMGDAAVPSFETVKKGVTDELTRVWRQASGAEADIKAWAESLNAANSPAQFQGVLATISDMIESKLSALENQRDQAMGKGGRDIAIITPQTRQNLDALKGSSAAPSNPYRKP
jgi:hypothetical protein